MFLALTVYCQLQEIKHQIDSTMDVTELNQYEEAKLDFKLQILFFLI